MKAAWESFKDGTWTREINVRDFISKNFTPYLGDASFLAGPTERTSRLWAQVAELMKVERERGVVGADTDVISSIVSHGPGFIDQAHELIVGLQTDAPLKRALMPFGGLRMAQSALEAYGYEMNPAVAKAFQATRKSHNEGVFDAYTAEMRAARSSAIITGLPDAYGRGRIIGDYRRVALYGVDALIADKQRQLNSLEVEAMLEDVIQLREEISEQIRALRELIQLGTIYGFDLRRPASTAQEAIQWVYLGYLAAIKEQNGAAMSIGRTSTFLDIYLQRDIESGRLSELRAQELVDDFVIKLRLVRFMRTTEYNELFSGDPVWVTEAIGGVALDGRPLVTKTSFRVLHTLNNLGPAPEPNLTVLWSQQLPKGFKEFCAKTSADTSSIQYENDDLMRGYWGDDYGIACCVSAMRIGKQMQFFGARANLAKCMLYAINGGRDEITGKQIAPEYAPVTGDYLEYGDVMRRFEQMMEWLAGLYINTLNVIHSMHDKYCYERLEMALHDKNVLRTMATGIAGLSVVADSLSAIRYGKVRVVRDAKGLVVDYVQEGGPTPCFGNDDEQVDSIAREVVNLFMEKLRKRKTYRNALTTMSILTITSNVVYGKKTGNTPCGRRQGEPFAPGANPMHNRDTCGAIASLASVSKLPYESAQDGISCTFSIVPGALGRSEGDRTDNLVELLDGYFKNGGHHINVNVFNPETLLDAMERPELYPQLTVRVSGYAVNFVKLTREQQLDVVNRTFHRRG